MYALAVAVLNLLSLVKSEFVEMSRMNAVQWLGE